MRILLFIVIGVAGGFGAARPPERSASKPAEVAAPTNAAVRVKPPLPPMPLDFRRLLEMSPREREEILRSRSAADRKIIEKKLEEYLSLPEPVREARLRALQVQLYFRSLAGLTPAQRQPRLEHVPEPDRPWVERKLAQWDALPEDLRAAILTNATLLRLLVTPQDLPGLQTLLAKASPRQRAAIEQAVARWQALPADRRKEVTERFEEFFTMPRQQRTETLATVDPAEKHRVEAALEMLAKLPPEKRRQCLIGFRKFAELTPRARAAFLRNVELWQRLQPEERDMWRRLASYLGRMRPPLPPGVELPERKPPLPPGVQAPPSSPSLPPAVGGSRAVGPAVVTNQ